MTVSTFLTALAAAAAIAVPITVGLMAYIRMMVAVKTQAAVEPIVRELAGFGTRLAVIETTLKQVQQATDSHPLAGEMQTLVGAVGILERKIDRLVVNGGTVGPRRGS